MTLPISVDVILPCLDEARAIPAVLAGLPPGYRAIVVDNGSSDSSGRIAADLGALVISEPTRGFGAACAAGLAAADASVVCFCDCDGSLDLAELPEVVRPVLAAEADLVLGARRPTRHAAMSVSARLANRALARQLRSLGVPVTDLGPMRAARRADLVSLGIRDRRSGWPLEMVLRAHTSGWRISEVPVSYCPRVGRSKVTGTLRGSATAVIDMRRAFRTTTVQTSASSTIETAVR